MLIAGFLFAFIPLYPKLPLADIIPGYIVRLRLEDVFVVIAVIIYGIQIIRKKAQWKTPFTWIIVGYAITGILSTLSAVFIIKTVPFQLLHIGKTLLHYFRYLEYFSLFFIAYSAVTSRRDLQKILFIFTLTVVLITAYGYGQKYFYWPLYSTMNREFSKGQRLYLTEHARVQSTFGGHYDLGGYLAVALPMLLALFYTVRQWKWRVPTLLSFIAGLWLLIMSASRASFAGFVAGSGLTILLLGLQRQSWKKKIWWTFSRGIATMFLISYMFITYGDSIYERFIQVLQPYPQVMRIYEDINDTRQNLITFNFSNIAKRFWPADIKPPKDGYAVTAEEQENTHVLVTSDEVPTATRPADVYVEVPDIITVSTTSAEGVTSTTTSTKERTYSYNALKYGLSMAIRLDTLWPQAIKGFQRNPLVGSGYATLTKSSIEQFTEAESTDNNFLRTLGETGLLGFMTFYGTIVISFFIAGKVILTSDSLFNKGVAVGLISAGVALLINAVYIDVYASSKVAFSYWALTGFVLAYFIKELKVNPMRPQIPDRNVKEAVLPKSNQ